MPALIAFLLLAFQDAPSPSNYFDAAIAALARRTRFSSTVTVSSVIGAKRDSARFVVSAIYPDQATLEAWLPPRPGQAASHRLFIYTGTQLVAYDYDSNQYTKRKAIGSGSLVERFVASAGVIEDAVAAQLSPKSMAAFFAPFRKLGGWKPKMIGTNSLTFTAPGKNGTSNVRFEFTRYTNLLTRALLVTPTSRLEWKIQNGTPPKKIAWTPPKGSLLVPNLTEHAEPPRFADKAAQKSLRQLVRAYGTFRQAAYTVTGTSGRSDVWISGDNYRERRRSGEWSFSKGVLTVKQRGKAYRGKCRRSEISSRLAAFRIAMDPILDKIVRHINPVENWLSPAFIVRSEGSITVNGRTDVAIGMRAGILEISILVRQNDYLLQSLTSRTKDKQGRIITRSERQFTYSSIGKPIPASTFAIASGATLPLPPPR